ncbi:MAG TPA: hypothetical protein VEO96_00660 [Thermoplasmata archaeon]|nr:hypothetical protein [Thermoplasmata archaeon]
MHKPSRHLPEALVLLLVVVALLPGAAAAPVLSDQAGGAKRVTWDFSTAADYDVTGVALAPGLATLAPVPSWWNFTSDAEFLAAEASATNVSVGSGLRLVDQAANLIQDGSFNQTQGPWTYVNGTTGRVLSARDAGRNARLWHLTPSAQFDSMDNVFGTRPWTAVSNGQSTSTLGQSTGTRHEGSGSLRDDVTLAKQGGGNNWVGALRDDPGTWNWSAYNRLGVWINVNASGLAASILLSNLGGQNWISWIPQSLSTGWHRYIFDVSPSFGTNNWIDQVEVGFLGYPGWYRAHVDDLVLFNYTAFDETANVSQAFTKPFATSGASGTLSLRFDVTATPSVNTVSYLKVNVGDFTSSESPVPVGTRTLTLDLSADSALRNSGSFNLTLSLELIRVGTEEASMSVSIDNVSLEAEQYADGSFTGAPIDAGSAAVFSAAVMQATADPPATSVAVETRTGNASSPGDSSWTAWALAAGSQITSPPNRFLQWRLSLGTDGAATPVVTYFSIRADAYRPPGILHTAPFLPGESVFGWESFRVNENRPPGTAIVYEISVDGGASWTWVVDGQDLSKLASKAMVLRVTLSSGNTSVSPSVTSLSVSYRPSMWSVLVSPWGGLLLLACGIAGYFGWKRYPYRSPTDDLFLIGLDGRLLVHTSVRRRAQMDEDILAGMLTAISAFVRDAFREEHEELKKFELGNRNVAVERGEYVYLAAIYPGALPLDVSRSIREFLSDLAERYGENLAFWYFADDLPGLPGMMAEFASRGRYRHGNWRKGARTELGPARGPTIGRSTAEAPKEETATLQGEPTAATVTPLRQR